ncbi:hypothetical protein LUX12_05635 [Streptomyces somaliensis]|uniref:hypothetical protein n=1 Tax=Streptomyces somaliensis TaxID=78355 RepID=UPI0020CE98E9|nr:hypothetical protein [Streptomyces somaliensis]MCP9944387.1 hypothetical protein [Streptomyces somaliensis]
MGLSVTRVQEAGGRLRFPRHDAQQAVERIVGEPLAVRLDERRGKIPRVVPFEGGGLLDGDHVVAQVVQEPLRVGSAGLLHEGDEGVVPPDGLPPPLVLPHAGFLEAGDPLSVEPRLRIPCRAGERVGVPLLEPQVALLVGFVLVVGPDVELVRQSDGPLGTEVVEEHPAEHLVPGVVPLQPDPLLQVLRFLTLQRLVRVALRDACLDLFDVADRVPVEPVCSSGIRLGGAPAERGIAQRETSALVGVVYRPYRFGDRLGPLQFAGRPRHARREGAAVLLLLRHFGVFVRDPPGIDRHPCFPGRRHKVVECSDPCGELRVGITEERGDGPCLDPRRGVLPTGRLEARLGRGRAGADPRPAGGDAEDVIGVRLSDPLEALGHVVPGGGRRDQR